MFDKKYLDHINLFVPGGLYAAKRFNGILNSLSNKISRMHINIKIYLTFKTLKMLSINL